MIRAVHRDDARPIHQFGVAVFVPDLFIWLCVTCLDQSIFHESLNVLGTELCLTRLTLIRIGKGQKTRGNPIIPIVISVQVGEIKLGPRRNVYFAVQIVRVRLTRRLSATPIVTEDALSDPKRLRCSKTTLSGHVYRDGIPGTPRLASEHDHRSPG